MAKERKANSNRKPPVPSEDHGPVEEWIADSMPAVQPLLTRIDEMIRETLSDLQYAIKWSKAYYRVPDHEWVIEVAGYHKSANIVFLGGADFDDPPPLGESDRSRYIKLHSVEELEESDAPAWIANAGRVPGWS